MAVKPEVKMEDGKLKLSLVADAGVDQDKDGINSAKASVAIAVELDEKEVIDELVKSSSAVAKLKEKLGL